MIVTPPQFYLSTRAILSMALALFLMSIAIPQKAFATQKPSVVSMNLCTDQLVLLLADPEQIISLSYLSHDERSSVYAEEAVAYPTNRGLAEEVYILKPDVIVTGTYSNWTASSMLEQLGMRVERFEPAYQFSDITANIKAMGELLHQSDRADQIIADFNARLADFQIDPAVQPRAALYAANGYTSGKSSIAHHILVAAGFRNIGAELGYDYGAKLAVESLLMTSPDLIVTNPPGFGHAKAEEMTRHPALDYFQKNMPTEVTTNKNWVCDTPLVLDAVAELTTLREAMARPLTQKEGSQ